MSKTALLIDNATKLIIAEPNPPGDLTAIEELQGQGFTFHSTTHQWACRALQGSTGLAVLNNDGASGDPTFRVTGELASLLNINSTGLMVRGSTGAWVGRTLVGTANQVTVTSASGLTGNPTLSLPQDLHTGATPQFTGMTLSGIPSAMLKTVSGGLTAAVAKTDYAPATFTGATGVLLKNDLAGGFTAAVAGVDYVPTGGTAANATNATKVTATSDTSTNTTFYPVFVGATGANQDPKVSDGANPMTWNPALGIFFAPLVQGRSIQATTVLSSELLGVTGDRDFSTATNWTGSNWKRPSTGTLTTFSVTANNTFHRTDAGSFITDGFQAGMSIVVVGYANGANNGTFTTTTVTASDITVTVTTLATVAIGASASFLSNCWSHATGSNNATNLPSAQMGHTPSSADTYQATLTIVTNATGVVTPSIGGSNGLILGGAAGTSTVTVDITAAGSADLTLTPDSNWRGFIDDVSVKEVSRGSMKINALAPITQTLNPVTGHTGELRSSWSKFQWTNAMVAALGATTTGNIKACSLPARTITKMAYLVIDTPGTGPTTLTVSLGRTGTLYNDYLLAGDAKAATNTVYGGASGGRGTGLTGYDLPNFIGTTDLYLQFVSTVGNLSTVTGSTGTLYLETVTLP